MTTPLTQGWLPLDFVFDPRPGIVTNVGVRWIEFGSTPLEEPFFWYTVEKLRGSTPPPVELESPMETMLRMGARLPATLPAGFIFHVSHCGSTLIANALRGAANTLVAAEATPFVRLASYLPDPANRYLRARWDDTRRQLFENAFRFFAHYRTGEAERLVIKFASIDLFGMKFVRRMWPDVPCVLVVRDPLAVLVSSLNEQGWLAHKNKPEVPETLYGWTDAPQPFAEMSDEEYCGRLLGRHLEAALEGVDDRTQVIDYEDLNARRMRDIASFFGLELPAEPEKLAQVFNVYSKDPAKAIPFRDDRAKKRGLASRAAVDAAQRWAMKSYVELRGRGAW